MKITRTLFIGLMLGAVIGWAAGFLRFPYIEENSSFWLGFIVCLALVLLTLILLFIWKKNSLFVKLISRSPTTENSNGIVRSYVIVWILVSIFIVFGGLVSSFLIYKQNKLLRNQTQFQNQRMRDQSELIESTRKSNMVMLMNDILDKVDEDLKNNSNRTLGNQTIASIVEAFNYSFEPYRYWEGDSLSQKKLSPEKGQLLLALCNRNIDSSSFRKIKVNASFNGADLRKAKMMGVDLSGADLKGADLKDAELSDINLSRADLRGANLGGADLNGAILSKVDLRRADLSWADVNDAQLDSANLNGADLSNVQLMKSDLRKATFRAAKLDGALLNEANLESGNLIDASLKKANLTRINLTNADVNRSNFNEAIMTEAELNKLLNVDKDWFKKLNEWHIKGVDQIQKKYKVVQYIVIENIPWYHLEKI
jgi:uncharacterized protein YjbI with pentapeptide repeats